jgi:CSLREA domain-containing protein
MKHNLSRAAIVYAACFATALGFAPRVSAIKAMQTFTVNSTADQVDDNPGDGACHTAAGTCTLRAAVMEANRATGLGATIVLPAGTYTRTLLPAGRNGDDSGDLDLTPPASGDPEIAIVGAGAATTIIDANHIDGVFSVDPSRTATISGVTIRNGHSSMGGGIYNQSGYLTLDHVIVTGNYAAQRGGGIFNTGTLIMSDSSLVSNVASSSGGGLYNFRGSVNMTGGTTALNTSLNGGGLANEAQLILVNSTVVGNAATYNGGGIYEQSGTASIYNSTIAYNDADSDANPIGYGGGVYIANATTVNIRNTLLVGNYVRGYPDFHSDCWGDGTLVPNGLNFTTTLGVCNVPNGAWSVLNSLAYLGPLQNNGGPTQTVALLSGSNAIDTGDPTFGFDCLDQYSNPILTDQRGFTRPAGYFCDVGAFEYGAVNPIDEIFKNGFE